MFLWLGTIDASLGLRGHILASKTYLGLKDTIYEAEEEEDPLFFIKLSAECFPHGCKLSPGQMAFPRIGGLLVTSLEKKKSAPFNLQIRQMSNSSLEMSILIDLLSSF